MTFAATIVTLYPEMFPGPLRLSLAGRALEEQKWSLDTVQLRDFAEDKHRTVDDTPAGGGAGMVLKPDVLGAAIDHARRLSPEAPVLAMTPASRSRRRGSASWPRDRGSRSCAAGSKGSTSAFSRAARSRKSRSAISSFRAENLRRWRYSTLAFACFPA